MKSYRIAVIAGDGIGKEVVPEGVRVLEAAGRKFGIAFEWDEFPWSCEYRLKHGRMMPEDGLATIRNHDAVFFGACGFPGVPDHVSLWELLIPMRRGFDLYVNLRPVRLMPGIQSPLAGRKQGDIDFWVVRENTEGEYSSIGGRIFEKAPSGKPWCSRAPSPGRAPTAYSGTRSSSRGAARRSTSPRRPSRTGSRSPCLTGTSAFAPWRRATPR